MSHCGKVLPSVGGYSPVWKDVPQCGVCPSVRGCVPLWEGVPSVGGYSPV